MLRLLFGSEFSFDLQILIRFRFNSASWYAASEWLSLVAASDDLHWSLLLSERLNEFPYNHFLILLNSFNFFSCPTNPSPVP